MRNTLFSIVFLSAGLALAGCDKTSEDHAREAQRHGERAQAEQAAGQHAQATQEQAHAAEDRAEARAAAADEGRHAPPDSAVPGYIKPSTP